VLDSGFRVDGVRNWPGGARVLDSGSKFRLLLSQILGVGSVDGALSMHVITPMLP
jgi:hypothetical protein